jgi:predicted Zn-dependent peptidase
MNNLRQILFLHHPLRKDISGTVQGLENITRPQVVDFFNKFLTADHMVISLFGDIASVSALEELRKRFGNMPKRKVDLSEFHEDFPKDLREKVLTMDKEQAAVLIGMRAPDIYDQDRYGMEVISSILGSSLSGRMFVKIREELGNAYTLGASYAPSLDAGFILLYVLTTDAQVDRVKEILFQQMRSLADVPVSKKELDATKSNLKGEFDMETHTINSLANMTALDELYGIGYNDYKNYKSKIDKISAEDIQRIAGKYFDPTHASIVVIHPKNVGKK